MARKPRLYSLLEDGLYHLIARGNNGKAIFEEQEDYQTWKKYLMDYKDKFSAKLLAYVLMPNHYHLLLKAGPYLSKLMGSFNARYAIYFNNKYKLKGHLFQGRYKSFLVGDDPYLITLIRYIHNNPIRANLAEDALEYEHSSLREYNKANGLVDSKEIERLVDERYRGTPLLHILS